MKSTPSFLAVLAAALLCPSIRGEDEKPIPPKTSDPVTAPEPGESPKREKPRRAEGAPEKPSPRLKPDGKAVEKLDSRTGSVSKRTWMGVSTRPVDPSLREHLEIPEGFGIQVVEVMPDSPAAQANLRGNDVVIRFEDQRLISPEHLSVLVRTRAGGEKVTLSLIRKGKEETVEVTLGEAEENLFGPFGDPSQAPYGSRVAPRFGQAPSQWQDQIRKQQDEILRQQKDWMERHRPERNGNRPDPRPKSGEVNPGGRPPGVSVSPGLPLRVFGTEGVLNIDNEQGELTLTRKNGKHHLVIEDTNGKVVYNGPFDPETGVEGLPKEAQEQLETMKLGNLEIHLPDPPTESPEKIVDPKKGKTTDDERRGEIL